MNDTPDDAVPGDEPGRMEIELSIPGMDPEVNAAMRERIKDGLRRMEKIHTRIEEFVEQATSVQPDGKTKNQHFISRFWLRLFHPKRVAVLDITADPFAERFGPVIPVKKAAAGAGIFTMRGEDSSPHEAMMGFLESKAAPIFKKMAVGQVPSDDFDRFIVSAYLAFIFLHAPATMRFSDEQVEERIADLARELADEHGIDLGSLHDLDALKQRYTFSAVFGRNSLISKAVLFFFCRSWHLVEMPERWPLALPMFPIVNWGQPLQTARDVSVVIAPNRVLLMSWPTLPDQSEELTDKQCIAICDALIRHAEATDGRLIVHPEHREHWARGIKGHQETARSERAPSAPDGEAQTGTRPEIIWACGQPFAARPSGLWAPLD